MAGTSGDVFYLEPVQHQEPADDDNDSIDNQVHNLRLTVDNLNNTATNHGVKFNDCPTGVTKDVVLSVDPKRHNYGRRATLSEVLFGIIPGFFGSGNGQDKRIMVQGLLPAGEAIRAGIKIGEWLMSVNGQDVDFDTIDNVLSHIVEPQQVTIVLQKIAIQTSPKPLVVSREHYLNNSVVSMVTGEEIPAALDDIIHGIIYLDPKKDVLYKYPDGISSPVADAWGVFVTLSHVLPNITDTHTATSTLLHKGELLHVIYHKEGERVLLLYVPAKLMLQVEAVNLLKDVVHVLYVCYGNLNCAFLQPDNYGRLDHYFTLVFHRALLQKEMLKHGAKQTQYIEPFLEVLPAVRGLILPEETKMVVNNCLSELEAMEFVEMSESYLDQRRMFVVVGSCLFYKGYLVCSHLSSLVLHDISLYLQHHCVLTLCQDEQLGQVLLWREVFPSTDPEYTVGYILPSNSRHFLLVVGLKNLMLCVLLETGGCASEVTGPVPLDHFYVDQAKAALLQMESHDVILHCRRRLQGPAVPSLACIEWFSSHKKKGMSSSHAADPPMAASLHTPPPNKQPESILKKTYPSPGGPQKQVRGTVFCDTDSDIDTISTGTSDSSFSEHKLWGSTKHESDEESALGLFKSNKMKRNLPNAYDMSGPRKGGGGSDVGSLVKLTSGCDNTLFHYIHVENTDGVFVCPSQYELSQVTTATHNQVLSNFHTACLAIRARFQRSQLKVTKHPVKEHGVNFKVAHKEETMSYWVVGRLFDEPSPREFYVCYHDSAQQNAVEMAFKLAFGTYI